MNTAVDIQDLQARLREALMIANDLDYSLGQKIRPEEPSTLPLSVLNDFHKVLLTGNAQQLQEFAAEYRIKKALGESPRTIRDLIKDCRTNHRMATRILRRMLEAGAVRFVHGGQHLRGGWVAV
jgi:hypothetical protein